MTAPGTLTIGTLRTSLFVSHEHPDPERLRADVTSALVARLHHALGRQGARLAPDDAVWLVRQLQVDADVDAAWDPDRVAETVAAALARSLARELTGSGDGVNTLRFDSRAAHLARYLVDRVDGAADRWYHRRFDGLRLLPLDAAVRTALTAAPADGLDALRLLGRAERRRVIDCLTPRGIASVLDGWSSLGSAASVDQCVCAALVRWRDIQAVSGCGIHANALALFVETAGDLAGGAPLRAAVELIALLADILNRLDPASRGALIATLDRREVNEALQLAPAIGACLQRATPVQLAGYVRTLNAWSTSSTTIGDVGVLWTPFGGVFLLLPDLDVETLRPIRVVADADEVNLRCVCLLTLALCLEGGAPGALAADGGLRNLFAIEPSVDVGAAWRAADVRVRTEVETAAARTLAGFAHRLPGFAASGREHLVANFLDVSASIECQPDRIVVRLERPPLHVLLSMTGLSRRRYDVSWLLDRPIELFPEV